MKQKYKSLTLILVTAMISGVGTYFAAEYLRTYKLVTDSEITRGVRTAYAKVVQQTEPIILTGDDVLLIENTEYILTSSILAQDNAKVIIKNSRFYQDLDYSPENHVLFYGDATMEITDSIVEVNKWVTWGFYDYSTLTETSVKHNTANPWLNLANNATGVFRDSLFRGTIADDAKLDIDGTKNRTHIEMVFPEGSIVDVSLPSDLEEFHFPSENDKGVGFQIDITNSKNLNWSITSRPDSDIIIRDAKGLNMTFSIGTSPGLEVELEDLQGQHYDDTSWELGSGTTRLINSSVHLWSPIAGKGNVLTLRNSDMSDLQYNSDDAKVYIYDSSIDLVSAIDDVYIRVENSTVYGQVYATDNGIVELINTKVIGEIKEEGNGEIIIR